MRPKREKHVEAVGGRLESGGSSAAVPSRREQKYLQNPKVQKEKHRFIIDHENLIDLGPKKPADHGHDGFSQSALKLIAELIIFYRTA